LMMLRIISAPTVSNSGRNAFTCLKKVSLLSFRSSPISFEWKYLNGQRIFREFHYGAVVFAPKNKKNDAVSAATTAHTLPDFKISYNSMDKILSSLSAELATIHVGRVSTDMFNNINIDNYGTIANVAQVTLKAPLKISITVFDPDVVKKVADAIRESGLNLNPQIEGNTLTLNIPKPSKETRESYIKIIHKNGEKFKQEIRQVRKDCMDSLKKCKGVVSDDEIKLATKEVEVRTEKMIDKIAATIKLKEKEIIMSA